MKPPTATCRICPDVCNPEYHRASASIHAWLRAKIRRALKPRVEDSNV